MNYEVLCDTNLNYIQLSSFHQLPLVTEVKIMDIRSMHQIQLIIIPQVITGRRKMLSIKAFMIYIKAFNFKQTSINLV